MKSIFIALVIATLSGCGSTQKFDTEQSKVSKPGLGTLAVDWIKMKSKKYDFKWTLTNDYNGSTIVLLSDIQCFKGNKMGTLKHTFFNTGERTIDFAQGQTKSFKTVCNLGANVEGAARIMILRIYSNPSNDGLTRKDVIAENIEWKAPVNK